ncbi:hypothetical protein [Microbacterium invictum]|uniref:Uncharacterized protein n=1 Tax=Microbacterium invictum TaxID=515415 RepID=A0AA40VMP0_9MICO|nr:MULTISPECIES: hypothetical protein [Microbacterium]MBB4140626.1 hypothetical protein [Microbacterium invictum]
MSLLYSSPDGHELRQFAGQPDTIATTAADYKSLGASMDATADTLRDIGESQISLGTNRLKEDAEALEGDLRKAAVRYEQTGTALEPYAPALEAARSAYTAHQGTIRDAMDVYRAALNDLMSPTSTDDEDDDGPTPAQAAETAEQDLRDAWQPFDTAFSAWEEAYERAADLVAEAMDAADNDDGKWDWIADALKIIGYVIIVLAVVALFVVSSPWAAIILAATIGLSALHLAGTVYLYANGKATLSDVLWSTFGLVTAGAGGLLSRGVSTAAASGDDIVNASRLAQDLPVFTRGARGFSMPRLPSGLSVNPFSTLMRGQSWSVLNRWGGSLTQWAQTPARSGTIAAAWGDMVVEAVPRISAVGWASLGNWVAGIGGGIFTSSPFYTPTGRP